MGRFIGICALNMLFHDINEKAFGVRYLVGYINRFKISGSYQRPKKWYLLPLCPMPDNKSESRGECLAQKKAQLIPCTVVLYDKGGTNQRASCVSAITKQ